MKILIVADVESLSLWDYYTPGKLAEYDLILSGGDLKAEYLSFLVTMARCPLMYVHGNHDDSYAVTPPEGCDSIDGKLIVYKGLRILGLGGSYRYSRGAHQYSERQMEKRICKLKRAVRAVGGVDIVLTHAAPRGVGDWEDHSHRGFEAFLNLIDSYHPQYLLHGHVHMNYGHNIQREWEYQGTKVINCCQKYEIDVDLAGNSAPVSPLKQRLCRLLVKELEFIDG